MIVLTYCCGPLKRCEFGKSFKEPSPDKELVRLKEMTESLMDEVKKGEISEGKFRRFRDQLNQFTAEMQLGSTLLTAISTANDIIQTMTGK